MEEQTIQLNRAIIFKQSIPLIEKRLEAMFYIMNRLHLKAKWMARIKNARSRHTSIPIGNRY